MRRRAAKIASRVFDSAQIAARPDAEKLRLDEVSVDGALFRRASAVMSALPWPPVKLSSSTAVLELWLSELPMSPNL